MITRFEVWFSQQPMGARVIGLLVAAIFVFGIFGPSMVSSRNTFSVWIGIIGCLLFAWLAYRLARPLFDKLMRSDQQ